MGAIQKRWKERPAALACPGCGVRLDTEGLIWPIPDLAERVLPGEVMPAGECPDCGELVLHDPLPALVDETDEEVAE